MKWEENIQSGSPLRFADVSNRNIGERMILSHPPEPPAHLLLNDPFNSIYIGRTRMMKVPFYWTFENLTNPHIAIVGVTGAGKSYLVKTFLTRAALVWKTNALIIDWAAEYVDWVRQTGGKVIELGEKNSLNLMDLGGNSPQKRIRQIMRTFDILLEGSLRDDEKRVLEEALEQAYLEKGFRLHEGQHPKPGTGNRKPDTENRPPKTENRKLETEILQPATGHPADLPTLKDVHRILLQKAEKAEAVWVKEYILNAAKTVGRFTKKGADFLARPSTLELSKLTESGLVDIVLKGLPDEEFRVLAGLSILQYLKERMRDESWSPTKGLKLYVVLDEAWKVAKDDRSDAIMIVREGRKYKFGLIVASQNPTDIHEAIFSNVGTTFVLNLKFQKFKEYVRASLKYSDFIAEAIEKFGVGNAAVNLMFSQKTDFPRTFLIDKVHGEEPLQELTMTTGGKELKFDRSEFKRKLSFEGIPFEFEGLVREGKLDSLDFVKWMESRAIPRKRMVDIFSYLGLELETIKGIFRNMEGEKNDG